MYDEAIYEIARSIEYAWGEAGMLDFGCGLCYHNDVFEMHGYWQHEGDECSAACQGANEFQHTSDCPNHSKNGWLFWHKPSGFKYTWYKRIGRSSEVVSGTGLRTLDWYKAVVECIESVKNDPNSDWRCARDG